MPGFSIPLNQRSLAPMKEQEGAYALNFNFFNLE